MSASIPNTIASLRARLVPMGQGDKPARVPLGHDAADACLKGGLPPGALHEVFAAGIGDEAAASGFATALAARIAAGRRLLWIRQDFASFEFGELSATGFLELGLDPSRLLLLRIADVSSALRAAADALSCAALGAVVIEIAGAPKSLDLVTSRRLVLAAAQKGVTVFLLRFSAEPDASAAETRWLIRAAHSTNKEDWVFPVFDAALSRNRHGTTGHWKMEWNCDERSFCEPRIGKVAPYSGAVVSHAADGPAAAAQETPRRFRESAA
jgi:protein ImuA